MSEIASVQAPCPWHRDLLQDLVQRHDQQRLPHALLLGGAPGIGKERLARSLLETLLCEQPRGGLACGRCRACHLSASGSHPDYYRLAPEEAGKPIKVDQVRALAEFSERTAQFGGYRVALVVPAEAMNRNAQNALLKTLEEPGANTLLLLVSHQPALLLPTIRSRCQQQSLPLPPEEAALDWLTEQLGDRDQARALLTAAGGAPLKAAELEQAEWFTRRGEWLRAWLEVLDGRRSATEAAQPVLREDPVAVLDGLYGWIAAALRAQATGIAPADAQLTEVLPELVRRAGRQRLLALAERILRARRALLAGANPNRELLFESLILALAGCNPAEPEMAGS